MKCIPQNSTRYIIKGYYRLLNESFLFLFGLTPVQKIIALEETEFQHKRRESKRKAKWVGRRGSCPEMSCALGYDYDSPGRLGTSHW